MRWRSELNKWQRKENENISIWEEPATHVSYAIQHLKFKGTTYTHIFTQKIAKQSIAQQNTNILAG